MSIETEKFISWVILKARKRFHFVWFKEGTHVHRHWKGKDIGNLAIRKDPHCANREKANNEVKGSLEVAL